MRTLISKDTLQQFMRILGQRASQETTIYFTGGATAIAFDFRAGTIDVDIAGDLHGILEHIPALKEELRINIEIAKPTDFVPSLAGEATRHIFIATQGKVTFMHFDSYAQTFAKIVRGHATDITDATSFLRSGKVDAKKLRGLVNDIPAEDFLSYPRLDHAAVIDVVESFTKSIN